MPSHRQVWTERLERYRRCSLTVKEYCRRERVSVPSFYQWRKKLGQPSPVGVKPVTAPAFLPVRIEPSHAVGQFVITLPGDATLAIDDTVDEPKLRKILASVIAVTAAEPSR